MSSYARVMIELRADVKLKDNIVVATPKITREGHYKCNVRVESLVKHSRCSGWSKNGFKHQKEYRPVFKKSTASSSGNKKKGVEPTIEVSNSNPFDVLNSVDNDVEFGTNWGTTNLVNNEATSSGSSFMHIDNDGDFASNILIGEKIDKIKRQICKGKLMPLDNDGNPLVPTAIVESDSEVEVEVGEDVARIRECRGVACGLKIVLRRREECIGELKVLGDCEGAAETVRFMEGMQLDDMNKCDHLLLLINEMEAKAREKSRQPLVTELCYKADSSHWGDVLTYFCREAADEDRTIATKLNRLREEMLVICEKRRNLANELRSIRGIVVVEKDAKFVVDTIRKDNDQVAWLHEVESQMEFRDLEKDPKEMANTGMSLLRELAGVADSTDIRDQLSVLFRREVNEESEKMSDYRRRYGEMVCIKSRELRFSRDSDIIAVKLLFVLKAFQELFVVPSTLQGMLKFPVEGGIATIRSTILIPTECASVTRSSVMPIEERTCPANFTVALHPDFPHQEVVIGGSLSEKGRTELCIILKKNLDIFAWQPSDMTGVPRSVAEHRLNIREGYSPLVEADEEKTTFHTGHEVYCYTKMPFALKNAGATYQRLMDKAFKGQVGRNIEVYVDDLVVKSHTEAEMVRDIEETLCTLRKVNMKLNPKKYSFGLAEGVFLGSRTSFPAAETTLVRATPIGRT
nr:reverse transcriptase domain-containing protein [Tanacetum cinerariifolium]